MASGTTRYDFASPLDADGAQFGDALIDGIMASRAFRRLKGVRFLGGIDYVLVRSPNGSRARYSRYEHSVGVACLAALHADLRDLSPEDRRLSCAAALLHDIGHAPLSHSLEPVFIEHFGLGHHRATEEIIYGRVAIGRERRRWRGGPRRRRRPRLKRRSTNSYLLGGASTGQVEGAR